MPKVLTAARVRVPTQHETEYVNTLRELSQFAEARGQRIWLYRNAKDPRLFSENSMNRRGSLALRYSQIRCPRASANWLSSRSVFTYSVSCCVGTRTRAAVRTFGMLTPLPRETPAAAA